MICGIIPTMARRCRTIWRAGVLRPPGKNVIPDGTRCRLEEGHDGDHDLVSLELPETSEVEHAAAELLQFLPTGQFSGIPIQNLRIALGAAYCRSDGARVEARRRPPDGWVVPSWAWDDRRKP